MKYSFRWLLLLLLCVLVLTALVLTGCDSGDTDATDGQGTAQGGNETDTGGGDDSTTHTHSFGEWSVITPATCQAKGEETRSCACGASEKRDVAIDPTAHSFGGWSVTTPATCQAKGEESRSCACGASEKRDVAMNLTAHSFGGWSVTTPATCVAKGEETRSCTCGASEKRDVAMNPTAHNPATAWTYDGTHHWHDCTHCGHDLDWATHDYDFENYCNDCRYYQEIGLVFTLQGDTYAVTDYTGTAHAVVIPSMYKGVAVTAIGNEAFNGCTGLTSITIPASVTTVGDYAFVGCTGLESIAVESGSTVYHSEGNCLIHTESKTLILGCKNSVIPTDNSVTAIGDYAFNGCTGLTSITIPASVTTVGDYAFVGCTGLTSITIPAGVTAIGSSAFFDCHKLIEVYNLSTTLTIRAGDAGNGYVGYYAKNVYTSTEGESKLFTTTDGYIFYDDGTHRYLMGYTGNSTTLTLPADCNGHSYEIYQYVFCNRADINSITIPASVTTIGEQAFYCCTGLISITIPAGVTTIGERAFDRCTGLESIAVESGNTVYHSEGNCLIHTESKTLIQGCKNSVIPTDDSVTAIGDYAFYDCTGLTSIAIPAGVTAIGNYAFSYCEGLTSVTFAADSKLTTIGDHAFFFCTGLTSITIPANVTAIGYDAFFGCFKLIEVYNLSTTLTITAGDVGNGYVGYYAKNVYTSTEGESKLSTTPDGYIFYDDGAHRYLVGYTGNGTTLTLPADCNGHSYEIYKYAFCNRADITSITIPASVTAIGNEAFSGCTGLTSVTFAAGSKLTTIGNYAFSGCTGLTSITIPASVTTIGVYAFDRCTALTSITIPAGVTTIGAYAFSGCTGLTTIQYRGTEAQWSGITKGTNWDYGTGNYTVIYNYTGE